MWWKGPVHGFPVAQRLRLEKKPDPLIVDIGSQGYDLNKPKEQFSKLGKLGFHFFLL